MPIWRKQPRLRRKPTLGARWISTALAADLLSREERGQTEPSPGVKVLFALAAAGEGGSGPATTYTDAGQAGSRARGTALTLRLGFPRPPGLLLTLGPGSLDAAG